MDVFAFSFQVVRVYHDGCILVFFFQTSLGSELESRTVNCWFRSTFHRAIKVNTAVSFAADIFTATDFSAAAADIFTATDILRYSHRYRYFYAAGITTAADCCCHPENMSDNDRYALYSPRYI